MNDIDSIRKQSLSRREFFAGLKQLAENAGINSAELANIIWAGEDKFDNELQAEAAYTFFEACRAAMYDAKYESDYYTLPQEIERMERAIAKTRRLMKQLHNTPIRTNEEIMTMIVEALEHHKPPKNEVRLARFSILSEATGDLLPGYYVFTGAPNAGKSAVVQNIILDALETNDNARAVIYSFDDSSDETIKRLIASTTARKCFLACPSLTVREGGTRISQVGRRPDVMASAEQLANLGQSVAEVGILTEQKRLRIYDRKEIATMNELENSIAEEKEYSIKHGLNLVVAVDACLKIDCRITGLRGLELDDYRADALDDLAAKHDIPLLTTHELRKPNPDDKNKKPTIEDTKGSGRYGYNAKFGAMIYPADKERFKTGEDLAIRCYIDKNKLTEHSGAHALMFEKAYCYIYQPAQIGAL